MLSLPQKNKKILSKGKIHWGDILHFYILHFLWYDYCHIIADFTLNISVPRSILSSHYRVLFPWSHTVLYIYWYLLTVRSCYCRYWKYLMEKCQKQMYHIMSLVVIERNCSSLAIPFSPFWFLLAGSEKTLINFPVLTCSIQDK